MNLFNHEDWENKEGHINNNFLDFKIIVNSNDKIIFRQQNKLMYISSLQNLIKKKKIYMTHLNLNFLKKKMHNPILSFELPNNKYYIRYEFLRNDVIEFLLDKNDLMYSSLWEFKKKLKKYLSKYYTFEN